MSGVKSVAIPFPEGAAMAAHVLVLANVTATSGDLIDAIRQRAEKGPIDC